MRTGWEIVIAGRDFNPASFFAESRLQPSRTWQHEIEEQGDRSLQHGVEFSDWHEGPYPLDMATEALDFLEAHRAEFQALCGLPGIEERCLNFVDGGNPEDKLSTFDFSSSEISLLASLRLSVSICARPSK